MDNEDIAVWSNEKGENMRKADKKPFSNRFDSLDFIQFIPVVILI